MAVVVAAPRTEALDPLCCLGFYLLFSLGDGVVVDVVVVDVLGGLLGDKSFTDEGAGSWRGRAWLWLAPWEAFRGVGAGAVSSHAG